MDWGTEWPYQMISIWEYSHMQMMWFWYPTQRVVYKQCGNLGNGDCMNVIQHWVMPTFLGVGKCAPLVMMYGDMYWIPTLYILATQDNKLRWSRTGFVCWKSPNRLNRHIFEWNYTYMPDVEAVCYSITKILEKCDTYMSELHEQKSAEHNTVAKITDTLRQ